MSVDFKEVLRQRGVEPNTTWMRTDGQEMLVVMPDDETIMREMLAEYVDDPPKDPHDPGWVRVVRLPVEGKSFARAEVMFIPFLCGQIDRGIIKRIG